MENNALNSINKPAELLKSLAKQHQVPIEIAEDMATLMHKYPDLSLWGSKAELVGQLEKVIDSAFRNKITGME